jgi:uncharacterized RDD family membrane protein YckC
LDKGTAMEANPYAAPGAVVEDSYAFDANDLEARKASRWQRLGAAFLDGIVISLCMMPVFFQSFAAYNARVHGQTPPAFALSGYMVFCFVLALVVIVVNCILLSRNAQTIGKKLLGIKIVRTDGSQATLGRIFLTRYLPIRLFGFIPLVGPIITIVDVLMIFGDERRCLHDRIADTIVVND